MRKRGCGRWAFVLCAGILAFVVPGCACAQTDAAAQPAARNVIVMISDGGGFNDYVATDYWQYGEEGRQVYESFPVRLGMDTHSIQGRTYDPAAARASFAWVRENPTDSAAAATALSTGSKTNDGAIGVDPQGRPLKHLVEIAEEQGKSTGVVTTVNFSHATPGGFAAHNPNRNDYPGIASEMLLRGALDVIIGCGHPEYDNAGRKVDAGQMEFQFVGGRELWEQLRAKKAGGDADGDGAPDPWTLIESREQFQRLAEGPAPKRLLGVPRVRQILQQARPGDANADPFQFPLTESVPTLAEMSRAALNVLDDNPRGFFLMIEGGAVDGAGHANQSGRMIEEMVDFNRAAEAVAEWVEKNGGWDRTLLVITSDHETGFLIGPDAQDGQPPNWAPVVNNGEGKLPGMKWLSGSHTNQLVPLFAKGPGAEMFLAETTAAPDPILGPWLDNTAIPKVIREVMK